MPHLLRCQGLAVKNYGFALGRLGSGTSSAFATIESTQFDIPNRIVTEDSDNKILTRFSEIKISHFKSRQNSLNNPENRYPTEMKKICSHHRIDPSG